jgi:hypothetical protein
MKKKYSYPVINTLLIIAFLSVIPLTGFSQEETTCAENLRNAQTLFDNGQVGEVAGLLSECLKSGFNREEELAAYKLIIQTLLFQDELDKADSTMLEFLRKNPEYELSQTDHSSFVHLYNNFNVKPVVQLVLHVGTNIPFLTFVDQHSVSGDAESSSEYTTEALNLFASLEAKLAIGSKLELNIEGGYSQLSFKNREDFLGIGIVNYSEVQNRVEIPVTMTYNFPDFGKFTAYARAGAGPAFNVSATAKDISFVRGDEISFSDRKSPEISRNDSRIKMDIFGQVGGGIKLKIPRGYLNFEIRTNIGIYNQVLYGGDSATQLVGYNYIDDDFNMNNVNLSFGYTLIFYKPSKRN